ncbi:hypothetical protein LCGC14_2849980, partial [marine sediment metagenome]
SRRFRERREWRLVVGSNEKLVLESYHQKCHSVLSDPSKNELLTEIFYV